MLGDRVIVMLGFGGLVGMVWVDRASEERAFGRRSARCEGLGVRAGQLDVRAWELVGLVKKRHRYVISGGLRERLVKSFEGLLAHLFALLSAKLCLCMLLNAHVVSIGLRNVFRERFLAVGAFSDAVTLSI